uniref:Uncharacterized protein n=1 Tax=Oryza glumipatula TaxID=40148 RepID=A0A0E0AJ90_9ORYZ
MGEMNWVSRKIHLYNVTMGLYMLDWWERCLFNFTVIVKSMSTWFDNAIQGTKVDPPFKLLNN